MDSKSGVYEQLKGKSRKQVIEIAEREVKKVLTAVNISHYRDIRVWKTSQYFRVKFAANIGIEQPEKAPEIPKRTSLNISAPRIESSITFVSNEKKDEVRPKDQKFLFHYSEEIFAVAKTFDPRDRLTFEEAGDSFRVHVSHPMKEDSTGGSEVYLINKKTHERELVKHVHPRPIGGSSSTTDIGGKPFVDPDPEIEIF